MMFEGFATRRIATSGCAEGIHLRTGGSGPPLLLLHGYPQTHVCWHLVAPRIADRFTLVMPDLRGYGDSGKPEPGEHCEAYSKRALAADMVEVMAALGHDTFFLAGHDRGGRVAHRLTLDHPQAVRKLVTLDIVPTLHRFDTIDRAGALGAYHWFFLAQPGGLPERLIGAEPEFFLRHTLKGWFGAEAEATPEAMAEYLRCFRAPGTIRATCAEYRVGANLDLEHDRADFDAGKRVTCPLRVLWGGGSSQGSGGGLLDVWRRFASGPVSGRGLACGHFLPEEKPEEVAAELVAHFLDGAG
jgi:haloacetate dehalogenase